MTQGISHLGLTVPNLDETVTFFTDALGWSIVGGDPEYPAVYIGDGSDVLTLWQALTDQPVAADREMIVGLHHVAFVVSTLEDLDEVFTRVSEYPGVEIEFSPQQNPVGVGPRVHFMFFEPGGNRVEMVCDPQ